MRRLLCLVLVAVFCVGLISCGGESGPKISGKLKDILDRAKMEEQSFREVPNGMRGFILYITAEDLKAISEAESVELLAAASFKYELNEKTLKGIRVRLMTKKTEGWQFGEVIRTKEGAKDEFGLFEHNKAEALKELGM